MHISDFTFCASPLYLKTDSRGCDPTPGDANKTLEETPNFHENPKETILDSFFFVTFDDQKPIRNQKPLEMTNAS